MIGGMASGGRPPKLTPAVRAAIVKSVARAVPYKYAAMQAGVTDRVVYAWLARGRRGAKGDGDFVQFLQDVEAAHAKAVAIMVAKVVKASGKSWQAAAWWLEKRCREFSPDRAELAALRKLVREMAADRGSDGAGDGNTPASAKASVVQDDGGDDGPPPGQAPG